MFSTRKFASWTNFSFHSLPKTQFVSLLIVGNCLLFMKTCTRSLLRRKRIWNLHFVQEKSAFFSLVIVCINMHTLAVSKWACRKVSTSHKNKCVCFFSIKRCMEEINLCLNLGRQPRLVNGHRIIMRWKLERSLSKLTHTGRRSNKSNSRTKNKQITRVI